METNQGRVDWGGGELTRGIFDRGIGWGDSLAGSSPRTGKWGLDRQFLCVNLGNFSEQI